MVLYLRGLYLRNSFDTVIDHHVLAHDQALASKFNLWIGSGCQPTRLLVQKLATVSVYDSFVVSMTATFRTALETDLQMTFLLLSHFSCFCLLWWLINDIAELDMVLILWGLFEQCSTASLPRIRLKGVSVDGLSWCWRWGLQNTVVFVIHSLMRCLGARNHWVEQRIFVRWLKLCHSALWYCFHMDHT